MTTYLLTRDVKKRAITIPFCEAACRSQWALDNITRREWMSSVRLDDDRYEFGEWCGYCHAFIPGYVPLDATFIAKMHSEDTYGLDDDLNAYRWAVAGEGPHAYDWSDKPHRLVYDLVNIAQALRDELAEYTDRGMYP